MKLIKAFPFPIREVQTDNGTEWTTQLLVKDPEKKTLFEKALAEMDIIYHRIRVATPRHNGKVERQHRLDEARFYSKMRMYSLEDGRKQLARLTFADTPSSLFKAFSAAAEHAAQFIPLIITVIFFIIIYS